MAEGLAQKLQQERLKYPGLLPREILVWRNWLKLHEREFDRFEYNVRVGKGVDPGESWPDEMRKMAIEISQKRIDAVVWKGPKPTIVEVEDRPGLSGIGQLIGYAALWRDTPRSSLDPDLLLVVPRINEDTLRVAQAAGIRVELVPTDFSELAPKK